MCAEKGLTVPAQEVDHIEPLDKRPDLRLVRSNLRPLCKPCHSRRTAEEQAFGRNTPSRPGWLKPSRVPLVIVCGPPASGKTRYVRQHASPGDMVIDLDEIAARLSGQPGHAWDRGKYLDAALRERNRMLASLGNETARRAWLILSEPTAEGRQWWRDTLHPERMVVLETSPQTCMANIARDPDRKADRTRRLVAEWWSAYERRPGDEIVRDA